MNVLFLSLLGFDSLNDNNIYSDLLRQFVKSGNSVYCISPIERRYKKNTHFKDNGHILRLKTGNVQKTNVIEKGISTLALESLFIKAIKKYFSDIKFDLVIYSTPPITFEKVIRYVKKRDGAMSYLLLKDIFPQNAVDIGMLSKKGIKGLIYKHFRRKEKQLYAASDRIGCMSRANVEYILSENSEISPSRVEESPNCIDAHIVRMQAKEVEAYRTKYGLPTDKKIFIYGGNLGRPQSVPFIVECLKACEGVDDAFFVVAGSGTDRHFLESYVKEYSPKHVKLLGNLPKEEYDTMVACCDVGLIFLDHRFNIPNFPSRLLAYMQAALPVLACTDKNTDMGKIIVDGGFGWWCESNDAEKFASLVKKISSLELLEYKEKSTEYLLEHYSAEKVYKKCFAPIFEAVETDKQKNSK